MNIGKFEPDHSQYLTELGLDDIDREELSIWNYKKSEFLFQQGSPLEHFLLVTKGRIKVFSMASSGRTLIFCYQNPGSILGEVEFMTHTAASSSVCAVTDVQCIAIPHERYRSYLSSNIRFMNHICQSMANIVTETSINGAVNILYPFEARLCAYISMTNKDGYFSETLTVVAEFLGTSYRHLLRTLEGLCKKEVLEKTESGYRIKDAQRLLDLGGKF